MLTGDDYAVAQRIASQLELDAAHGNLLPEDKLTQTETLLEEKPGGFLAFVGDGINDAPVLRRSDLGIAMGAMGSDAAIEAADVVLMDDDLRNLPRAMAIARKTRTIAKENIVFALGIKAVSCCWALLESPICGWLYLRMWEWPCWQFSMPAD